MLELSASPVGNPDFQYHLYIPYYTASPKTEVYTAMVKTCVLPSDVDRDEVVSSLKFEFMGFNSAGHLDYSIYNPGYACHAVGSFRSDGTLAWIQTAVGMEKKLVPDIGSPRSVMTSSSSYTQDIPGVYAVYSDSLSWVAKANLPNNNVRQMVQSEDYIFFIDAFEIVKMNKTTLATESYAVPFPVKEISPPDVRLVYSDGKVLSYTISYGGYNSWVNVDLEDPSKATVTELDLGTSPPGAQSDSTYVFTQPLPDGEAIFTTITLDGTSISKISTVQCLLPYGIFYTTYPTTTRVTNTGSIFFQINSTYIGLMSNNKIQWVKKVNANSCKINHIDTHNTTLAVALSCGIENTPNPLTTDNYIITLDINGNWMSQDALLTDVIIGSGVCTQGSSLQTFDAKPLKIGDSTSMDVMLPDDHTMEITVSKSQSVSVEVDGDYVLQKTVVESVMCDNGAGVVLALSNVEALRQDCKFTWPDAGKMPDGVSWNESPLPGVEIGLDVCVANWNGMETKTVQVDLPVFCSFGAWTGSVHVDLVLSPGKQDHDEVDADNGKQARDMSNFLD
mmetsp:Transcript_38697/g.44005  ORF Transcript_38697/g.44005 Transcript_38697/m.44005 type:complete len:562 (+) Transcript_38697:3-1688(+)